MMSKRVSNRLFSLLYFSLLEFYMFLPPAQRGKYSPPLTTVTWDYYAQRWCRQLNMTYRHVVTDPQKRNGQEKCCVTSFAPYSVCNVFSCGTMLARNDGGGATVGVYLLVP